MESSAMFLVALSNPGILWLVLSTLTKIALLLLSSSLWLQGRASTILSIFPDTYTLLTVIAIHIFWRFKKDLLHYFQTKQNFDYFFFAINLFLFLRSNNFSPLTGPKKDLICLVIYLVHISEHLVLIESFV